MVTNKKAPRITVAALARQAGVSYRTASSWLRDERRTRDSKAEALEQAFVQLGGVVAKVGGEEAFLRSLLRLPAPNLKPTA